MKILRCAHASAFSFSAMASIAFGQSTPAPAESPVGSAAPAATLASSPVPDAPAASAPLAGARRGFAQRGPQTRKPVPAGFLSRSQTSNNPNLPTLYIIGDSTASDNPTDPNIQGWGTSFLNYFDSSKINVNNRALGGRSSRSFIYEGHEDELLAMLKPGDTVLIQWGHNDPYDLNESQLRGSLFGLGEDTMDIVRINDGKPETLHTFGWYMRKYVTDIRAKGATPIILTLTVRDRWNKDAPTTIERNPLPDPNLFKDSNDRSHKEPPIYSVWSAEVAKAMNVPLLDVHNLIADWYDKSGQTVVDTYFQSASNPTHRNEAGAAKDAELTLAVLRAYEGSSFDVFLNDKGKAIPAADSKYVFPNKALAAAPQPGAKAGAAAPAPAAK